MPAKKSEGANTEAKSSNGKKKTILIVEDSPDMQEIYKNYLSKDYSIIMTGAAKEGMENLKKHAIDLLILDIILPEVQGDTFFVQLRQMAQFKNLKVLVITVLGDLTGQFKNLNSNVSCMAKPFEKEALLAKIKMVIGR
ncbi:MAG TPA: response regulator [Candidatus Nanoarchaeia archaeon]|nr:response regulator [Candidatus Nanoarchaeia archaeon]